MRARCDRCDQCDTRDARRSGTREPLRDHSRHRVREQMEVRPAKMIRNREHIHIKRISINASHRMRARSAVAWEVDSRAGERGWVEVGKRGVVVGGVSQPIVKHENALGTVTVESVCEDHFATVVAHATRPLGATCVCDRQLDCQGWREIKADCRQIVWSWSCCALIVRWSSFLVMLLGCSSAQETTQTNVDRWEVTASGGTSPTVLLLAVDDGVESSALRGSITLEALTANLHGLLDPETDPASWVSVDARVFVAHSSNPGVIVGPLTLQTVHVTDSDLRTLADSVLTELRRPSTVAAPNTVLLAARNASDLLEGRRLPMNADEAHVVASLPVILPIEHMTVMSARDDASPGAPASYALDHAVNRSASFVGNGNASTPRIAAWKTASGAWEGQGQPQDLFPRGSQWGTGSPCNTAFDRIRREPDGHAACVITIAARALSSCDAARGWGDPVANGVSKATWKQGREGPERVCEIQQLESSALASCVKGSGPDAAGFCLSPTAYAACGWGFRFPTRAFPYGLGRVKVI